MHALLEIAFTAADKEAYLYQGVRKIINGLTINVEYSPVRGIIKTTGGFGAKNGGFGLRFDQLYGANKFKQLVRNYVDEKEFERVRTILERRKGKAFTSVALSMRGAQKTARSMGWCLLSIVITRTKDGDAVEVQYRSTELTLKFGGDLCFLPWVFDQIGVQPKRVTFRFANCFLSGVYLPYLASFASNPVDMLSTLKQKDSKFFANGTRFLLRSAMQKDQFFPYSPENVAHRFLWKTLDEDEIEMMRLFLRREHKKLGPLDWADVHHVKGEYVPRAKRAEEDE